jgi:protein-disulfide isomerase
LPRVHLIAALFALFIAAGCAAQTAPTPLDPNLSRQIENLIRVSYNVPQDYTVTLGPRNPSRTAGFDAISVTLVNGGNAKIVEFLISKDNKTLARLETFDLSKSGDASIDIAGRPVRGNPAAKVTLVNFDDLECPVCAHMHQVLFPATLERYKDKVRFVYKDNPLTELHPWAMHAAIDANCLADQSGVIYWSYVDYLHTHGQEVTGPDRNVQKSFAALDRIAREQSAGKLDAARLDACLAKGDDSAVRASQKEAEALGLNFTPAIFVNGERIDGFIPQEKVWMVIDRALRNAGVEPPPPAPPAVAPKLGVSGR